MSLKTRLEKSSTGLARRPVYRIPDAGASKAYEIGGFYYARVADILPNPNEPRRHLNEQALRDLASTIEKRGILQPLGVCVEGDQLVLAFGGRRLKAARRVGLDTVPVVVVGKDAAIISLIENVQREDLTPVEKAEAYQRVLDEGGLMQKDLAELVGQSKAAVSEILSLNHLPAKIKDEVRTSELPKQILVELAREKDAGRQERLFSKAKDGALTVRDLRTEKKPRSEHRSKVDIICAQLQQLIKQARKLEALGVEDRDRLQVNARELMDILGEL